VIATVMWKLSIILLLITANLVESDIQVVSGVQKKGESVLEMPGREKVARSEDTVLREIMEIICEWLWIGSPRT